MALTEQQFIVLEGNIRKVWQAYHKMKKDFIPDLFNVVTKKTAQYTDYTVGAVGRMTPWAGSVEYDSFDSGYEKQYKAEKYSTGIQVSKDLYEDGEYERLKPYIREVAYGVYKTLAYESVDIFNNATNSTSYAGPDSQALGSASHKVTPSSGTQSNLGTNELTYTGVETTRLAMEAFTDDRSDKMLIMGDMIIAGPAQRDNCIKLFGSEREAYTADNTKNAYEGMKFYIHPLMTGNRWLMVNEDLMKGGSGLNFFMRKDPRNIERDGDAAKGDFNTEMLSWKSIGRWKKGWTNWFWAYVNDPS